jgi:hypothetical protein
VQLQLALAESAAAAHAAHAASAHNESNEILLEPDPATEPQAMAKPGWSLAWMDQRARSTEQYKAARRRIITHLTTSSLYSLPELVIRIIISHIYPDPIWKIFFSDGKEGKMSCQKFWLSVLLSSSDQAVLDGHDMERLYSYAYKEVVIESTLRKGTNAYSDFVYGECYPVWLLTVGC